MVSGRVVEQLRALTSGSVERVAGANRYATAAAISRATFAPGVPVAYVATGEDFPDALAAIPLAARTASPVLLTPGDVLARDTVRELRRLDPGRIVVLGGTAVIRDAVLDALEPLTDGRVTRIAGDDRYETAAMVAGRLGASTSAYLATGSAYPDALAGGPAAASMGAPLLLVAPDALPAPTARRLGRMAPDRLIVLGGLASVRDETAAAAARAAR